MASLEASRRRAQLALLASGAEFAFGDAPARRLAKLSAAYGRAPIERLQLAAYPADRPHP